MSKSIIDPLVADVFTAMFNESAGTTERVFENYETTIADLRRAYVELYEAVSNANFKVDSLRIDNILADADYQYRSALRGVAEK